MVRRQHRESRETSQRQLRVGELLRHALAEMLTRGEVHDPVLEGHIVTVPEVRMSADLRLNEWLSFALMMPIVFGASFQTPLVMMFLHKIGLLSVQTFREKRRIAWFVMAVFAAVITPSVDAFSMLFLWVPMGALYELGILLCVYQGEQDALAEWEQEEKTGELVEV